MGRRCRRLGQSDRRFANGATCRGTARVGLGSRWRCSFRAILRIEAGDEGSLARCSAESTTSVDGRRRRRTAVDYPIRHALPAKLDSLTTHRPVIPIARTALPVRVRQSSSPRSRPSGASTAARSINHSTSATRVRVFTVGGNLRNLSDSCETMSSDASLNEWIVCGWPRIRSGKSRRATFLGRNSTRACLGHALRCSRTNAAANEFRPSQPR